MTSFESLNLSRERVEQVLAQIRPEFPECFFSVNELVPKTGKFELVIIGKAFKTSTDFLEEQVKEKYGICCTIIQDSDIPEFDYLDEELR
jgi:hypothetical protein